MDLSWHIAIGPVDEERQQLSQLNLFAKY